MTGLGFSTLGFSAAVFTGGYPSATGGGVTPLGITGDVRTVLRADPADPFSASPVRAVLLDDPTDPWAAAATRTIRI